MIELLASAMIIGAVQISPNQMNVDLLFSDGSIITMTEHVDDYDTLVSLLK